MMTPTAAAPAVAFAVGLPVPISYPQKMRAVTLPTFATVDDMKELHSFIKPSNGVKKIRDAVD
jgi:hypothetical protein